MEYQIIKYRKISGPGIVNDASDFCEMMVKLSHETQGFTIIDSIPKQLFVDYISKLDQLIILLGSLSFESIKPPKEGFNCYFWRVNDGITKDDMINILQIFHDILNEKLQNKTINFSDLLLSFSQSSIYLDAPRDLMIYDDYLRHLIKPRNYELLKTDIQLFLDEGFRSKQRFKRYPNRIYLV